MTDTFFCYLFEATENTRPDIAILDNARAYSKDGHPKICFNVRVFDHYKFLKLFTAYSATVYRRAEIPTLTLTQSSPLQCTSVRTAAPATFLVFLEDFLRARASIALARISYGNSVRLSVRLLRLVPIQAKVR